MNRDTLVMIGWLLVVCVSMFGLGWTEHARRQKNAADTRGQHDYVLAHTMNTSGSPALFKFEMTDTVVGGMEDEKHQILLNDTLDPSTKICWRNQCHELRAFFGYEHAKIK